MSLRALDLGAVQLTSASDKLNLSVQTTVTLQLPVSIEMLDNSVIAKLLMSGNIWTIRGEGCCIHVAINLDEEVCDETQLTDVVEMIKYQLIYAPVSISFFLRCFSR